MKTIQTSFGPGTAIIVGASSGIGLGLAECLLSKGYRVGVTGRRKALLTALKKRYPGRVFTSCFDITDRSKTIRCLDSLIRRLKGLDIFIYSSGQGATNAKLMYSLDYNVIKVNILGFTNAMTHIFKYMQKRGHGQLVSISSIAGLRGNDIHAAYHASKSYQCIYMEGLRKKAFKERLNIRVTDVRPGFVQTDFISKRPRILVAPLAKAVKQIYSAIKKHRKVVYVTRRYIILAVLMKIFPCCLYDRCP